MYMKEKPHFGHDILRPSLFLIAWILIVIGLIGAIVQPVVAQNMTITSLDLVGKQAVILYSSGGVLLGTYNTSSNVVPLPTTDFVLVLKPNAVTRFSNPVLFLTDITAALETYWLQIFMIGCLFVGLMAVAAYGRRH